MKFWVSMVHINKKKSELCQLTELSFYVGSGNKKINSFWNHTNYIEHIVVKSINQNGKEVLQK